MPQRHTREDWLKHGFQVLAAQGYHRLKAEPLARSLGVTRGSFYWHFDDIEQFYRALLEDWKRRATEQVIADVERLPEGTDRLAALLGIALTSDKTVERAIRAWATHNPMVAGALAQVDARRIDYLRQIFEDDHAGGAGLRARLAYWVYLGRVMEADDAEGMTDRQITDIAALLRGQIG